MTSKDLFASILQQAIKGELVNHLDSDGSAQDLIDQIENEKKRQIDEYNAANPGKKQKKYVAPSPIPDDEIPFPIPDNWKWVRLGEICEVLDIDHKMPEEVSEGIPYVSPLNFYGQNEINFQKAKKISKDDFDKLSKKCKPGQGDIIFPRYGTIGILRLIKTDIDFLVSYSCATIKPYYALKTSNILYYFLQSPFIQNNEISKYINKTTQPNIGLQSITKFLLPLPPLAEQARIVAKLEALKPLVEEYGKANERLETLNKNLPDELKASVLQEAIRGLLTTQLPSDGDAQTLIDQIESEKKANIPAKKKYIPPQPVSPDDAPFKIPNNWKWVRACEVFESMESRKPTGEIFKYIDIDAIDNKANKYVAKEVLTINAPSRASRKTQKGDVLFSMVRPYLKNITIVEEDDCIASTGFYVCRSKAYYPYFLLYLMLSNYVVDGLNVYVKGDNSPSINSDNILNFLIPLPPLAEQTRIVSKLEEIFEKIEKLRV